MEDRSRSHQSQQHGEVTQLQLPGPVGLLHREGVDVPRLVCHQHLVLGLAKHQGGAAPHHPPGTRESPRHTGRMCEVRHIN